MAENLIFNYLGINDVLPEPKNNGNIYFKLVSKSNENENIYGHAKSFEIAIDLEGERYFITPTLSTEEINGLLSLEDKQKINNLPYGDSVVVKELFEENNVVLNITEGETEPSGDLIIKDDKVKLNLNIPKTLIKGKDGKDGITPQIEETVDMTIDPFNKEKEPTAFFDKNENRYRLKLNFPKLQGEDGIDGKPGSPGSPAQIRRINVTLTENDDNPSGITNQVEGLDNTWDISINLPKKQLIGPPGPIGPRGYQGYKGDTGSLQNFSIQDDQDGNIINNIETVADDDGELDGLNISRHYSPVLQKRTVDNNPASYSILYKTNNNFESYDYSTLTPTNGTLCYKNNKLQYTTLPIEYGGTGQTSLNNGILIKTTNGIESKEIQSSNSILVTNSNTLVEITSSSGAFYSEGSLPKYGTLPVTYGGTGQISFSENSILLGNGKNSISTIANSEGAFFSNGEDAPQFGILPVSLGGTGASNALQARINIGATHSTLSSNGKTDTNVTGVTEKDNFKLELRNVVTPVSTAVEPDMAIDD